ncbi:hypothetical protein IMZ31_18855 (plasmid) [Pontibacillus sp. ALD_SL1]|uniref:hypothetical protein n=1 Tax=Pontibacillus sp. ALD_SL1 TaxID=2777185 RepID=UPI001A96350D|nr:hypothetical protein [Pontibacillus sp. ALD_SL1]QST02609.1 hypothetical protein IMZ31_18855 [Pontibacillus sp. ALD_SL1]
MKRSKTIKERDDLMFWYAIIDERTMELKAITQGAYEAAVSFQDGLDSQQTRLLTLSEHKGWRERVFPESTEETGPQSHFHAVLYGEDKRLIAITEADSSENAMRKIRNSMGLSQLEVLELNEYVDWAEERIPLGKRSRIETERGMVTAMLREDPHHTWYENGAGVIEYTLSGAIEGVAEVLFDVGEFNGCLSFVPTDEKDHIPDSFLLPESEYMKQYPETFRYKMQRFLEEEAEQDFKRLFAKYA